MKKKIAITFAAITATAILMCPLLTYENVTYNVWHGWIDTAYSCKKIW